MKINGTRLRVPNDVVGKGMAQVPMPKVGTHEHNGESAVDISNHADIKRNRETTNRAIEVGLDRSTVAS